MTGKGAEQGGQDRAGEPRPRQGALTPAPVMGGTGSGRDRLVAMASQVRDIPGVVGVVLQGADVAAGAPRSLLEEQSTRLERLGRRLGEAFRAGRPVVGVMQGSERNALLLTTRDHQLVVLIQADGQAEAVQARIRKLLSGQL